MDRVEVARRLGDYRWYHVIDLGHGVSTPGVESHLPSQQKVLAALQAIDFKGLRVLDIGCRDGLYSFEAEKRGAARVVGIDNDLSAGAVELLIPALESRVEMCQMNVLDLTPGTFGRFDVVVFAGVLYHLRYPFQAMRVIREVLEEGGRLVLETAIFADSNRHPYLYCPIDDENPYDATSVTLFNLKGLRDSLRSFGLVCESEVLQCGFEPDPKDEKKVIDRVCLVCRKSSHVVRAGVQSYWEGLHSVHSRNVPPE